MGFTLTAADERKLVGVAAPLVAVVRLAAKQSTFPFMVIEGLRSSKRQAQLYREGKSWVRVSKHQSGRAVDLAPLVNGAPFWHWSGGHYAELAARMKAAAEELGVPIIWGGDWKKKDGPHWELEG